MSTIRESSAGAHRYESSRPWGVAGLTAAATAAVVLLFGSAAHALDSVDPGALLMRLGSLAEKQTGAVHRNERLDREDGGKNRPIADLTHYAVTHQHPPRGGIRSSREIFNEALSGQPAASSTGAARG